MENKEKKEAERAAKLAAKEREREKAKAKGKRSEDGEFVMPTSSTVDQSSLMEAGARSGMKRKAALLEFSEEMVTQGT